MIKSSFLKDKEEHKSVRIYRDDSKIENLVGFAVVLPSQMLNGGLPGAASIFTPEIYYATEQQFSANRPGSYTIVSDFKSVLLVLKSSTRNSAMITKIHLLFYHAATKEIHKNLCWVSDHSSMCRK